MRKRLLASALLALALLGAAAARARADNGSAGAQPFAFLGLDSSARAAAMGGAYTALATNSDALQYNPAGLGLLSENEAAFMHNQYFQSATQEHLALALRPGFALSADLLNYGTLTRTTYSSPDGGLGTFSIVDSAVSLGYGRAFGPLSFGVAGKWIREDNDGTVGQAPAGDVGLLYSVPGAPGLRLGAAAQNLGSKVRFQSDEETLPATARAGAAWSFEAFGFADAVSLDATKEGSDRVRASGGVETVAGGGIALRVGYTTRNNTGPGISAGVGWRGALWAIDYSIAPYGDLGLVNRVGVSLHWGRREDDLPPPDPIELEAEHAARRDRTRREAESAALPAEIRLGSSAPELSIPPEDRIVKARKLVDAGRFDDATIELDATDRVLGPDDRARVGWNEVYGRLERAKKNLPAARAAYTEALRVAIKDGEAGQTVADCYEGLGMTLADQGQPGYAVKFLRKAYEISPAQRLLDLIEGYERRGVKP